MRHAVKKIVAICSLVLSKVGRSCGVKLFQVLLEFPWFCSADVLEALQRVSDRDLKVP